MKKILFPIIALVALILSSCSNDDIEIVETQPKNSFTCNVNPKSLYDEFDITDNITELVRDKDNAIRVYALLYNTNGDLVKGLLITGPNLNTKTFTFDAIEEGDYTLVVVQTCIPKAASSDEYVMNAFDLVNASKLSTLCIKQKENYVKFYQALGVATKNISISKNVNSVTISPKAIGSLIDIYYCGYKNSSYLTLGLATRDKIMYYKLDPSLSYDARYITDPTSTNKTNVRSRMTNTTEDIINNTVYVLEKNVQWNIAWQEDESAVTSDLWTGYFSQATKKSLTDGETYYLGAGYIDDDTAPSTCWGTLDQVNNWYQEYLKTSVKTNNIIPNLYTTWGGSVAGTQSFMKDYTMIMGSAGKAAATEDGLYTIMYQGKDKEKAIAYYYETPTTGLYATLLLYDKTSVSLNEMTANMNNNYTYLRSGTEDGVLTYYYTTQDKKSILLLQNLDENLVIQIWDANQLDIDLSNMVLYAPQNRKRTTEDIMYSKNKMFRAPVQKGDGERLKKVTLQFAQLVK